MSPHVLLLSLCGFLVIVNGQSTPEPPPPVIDGPCPTYTPVATLDSKGMAGKWFVVNEVRGGFGPYQPGNSDKCLTWDVTPKPDGSLDYKYNLVTPDNKPFDGVITSSLIDGKNTKLNLKAGNATSVMTFLVADPKSHFSYVVCETDGKTHRFIVEVGSRQKTLPAPALTAVKAALTANKLPTELQPIAQTC